MSIPHAMRVGQVCLYSALYMLVGGQVGLADSLTSEEIVQHERRTEAQIIEEWKKIEEQAVMCALQEKMNMAKAKYYRKYLLIESLWKLADKLAVAKRPNSLCQDDDDCTAKMEELARDIQVMHQENKKQVDAAYDRIEQEIQEREPGFALERVRDFARAVQPAV